MPALPPDDPTDVYNRRAFAYASTTVVLTLSIISYLLRLGARKKSGQPLKADDYLMGAGLFISFLPAICEYVLLSNGVGHHVWNVPPKQLYNFTRASFALQRANQPSLVCIKLSILLFYLRLFPSRRFVIAAYINIAYTIMWGIATWIVNLNVCSPVAYFYDKTIPGGHCSNQAVSGTINGCLSLLGDVMILILPIPMVWGLQINLRRRLALLGIFLLGTLVCISSAIRIAAVISFTTTDPTYTQEYAACWTYMEMGCAVISGNLPLLRPYFEPFFRNVVTGSATLFTKSGSGSNNNNNNNNNNQHSKNRDYYSRGSRGVGTGNLSQLARSGKSTVVGLDHDGFERISDDDLTVGARGGVSGNGSDVELCDRAIMVKTDLVVTTESLRDGEELGGIKKQNEGW